MRRSTASRPCRRRTQPSREQPKPAKEKEINTPELVTAAQAELHRLGCLDRRRDGKLDKMTRVGLNKSTKPITSRCRTRSTSRSTMNFWRSSKPKKAPPAWLLRCRRNKRKNISTAARSTAGRTASAARGASPGAGRTRSAAERALYAASIRRWRRWLWRRRRGRRQWRRRWRRRCQHGRRRLLNFSVWVQPMGATFLRGRECKTLNARPARCFPAGWRIWAAAA